MDNNSKLISTINQLLHNKGVKQEERFDLMIQLLENNRKQIVTEKYEDILSIINNLDYSNKDLIQEIFMLFGSKLTKYKLDQFYTPLTISYFIARLMDNSQGKKAIDPAGGTGDLLLYYSGNKTIWDIDENSLKLCKFNYELNKNSNYKLVCQNSLVNFTSEEGTYDYVAMNPPFGSSTTITDKAILNKFELGKDKNKQEIGILFLELGLKLLKKNGIMFAIIPAGYVGNCNKTCSELRQLLLKNKVIASIELPKNTFKRSGTGVNTYILIVQKNEDEKNNNIYISQLENIGYNLTKKETPIKYKFTKETGELLKDANGKQIVDNDFEKCYNQISKYCRDNQITHFNVGETYEEYDSIHSAKLTNTILDVKRYSNQYVSLIERLKQNCSVTVNSLSKIVNSNTKIENNKKYRYIDIGEINSPLYSYKELYGWELPSRAKYTLKKNDILISKLEGNISYCIILDDAENYIATNGVAVLRAKNEESLYILFRSIMKKDFEVQHNAYLTGSIMASLSDANIGEFLVDNTNTNLESTKKIIETLEQFYISRL
jgi:predicted RNA methylase